MRAEAGPLLAAVVLLGCSSSLPGRIEAAFRDADSTRATSAIADTTRRTFPPPPSGIDLGRLTVEPLPQPPEAAPAIDVTAERKLGAASLEDVIRFHRAVILDMLPVSRPTLIYQRGGGNAQLAGIRLQTTAFRRRLYAAYTRNEANGWSPLLSAKTSRYALRAELGRVGAHRFELEGALHERTIEDSVSAGALSERPGRSEWD